MLSQPLIADRHIKWASFIQSFHTLIQYQPGHENKVVDALNQMSYVHNISIVSAENFASMIDTYADDHDFSVIYAHICGDTSFIHASYSFHDGYLFYKKQLCITSHFHEIVLQECHEPSYVGHHGIATTIHLVESQFF